MSDPNTRKEKRTPVTLKIKFKSATLDQFIERYSVDVSHGGIFIRTKDPLAVGTQLRFEFQLQDASPLISGEGTVVWTREHDPARVGVAPGMGVRFDKLAAESQAVLDKILAMKTKESGVEPKFDVGGAMNEPKTRVAPAPLVSGLQAQSAENTRVAATPTAPGGPRSTVMGLGPQLAVPPSGGVPVASGKGHAGPSTGKPNTVPAKAVGNMAPSKGGFPDEPSRDATPLPKPMPFSSVDDDFSEEAFNQPTRVAGSFEDLLRKAEQEAAANEGKGAAASAASQMPVEPKVTVLPSVGGGNGSNGSVARGTGETAAAEAAAAAEKRAAEVRQAEENEIKAAADKRAAAERKAAEERAAADKKAAEAKASAQKAAESRLADERAAEAARPARRSGTQNTLPSVDYREKKKRSPALLIGAIVVVVGAGGAYALMNRGGGGGGGDEQLATNPATEPTPTQPAVTAPVVPTPAAAVTVDAGAATAPPVAVPKGIEVQVVSTPPGATVMADGKSVGVTPVTLPGLEDGKAYDITLELACYQSAKLSIDTAKEKADDKKVEATLKPLPRVVRVDSQPKGGAIWIDGVNTGKQSPADVPLAGKLDPTKAHKVSIKKSGFQTGETEVAPDAVCTAENGKAVLIASLTLAEVEKKAPPVAEVKQPREPTPRKPKPPKDEPVTDDGTPPTGLMPKDPNAPKDSGTPTVTPPPTEKPKETPKEQPKEPPKEPPKDDGDHAPDWMKEG